MEKGSYAKTAVDYFMQGYNCSQAVFAAFHSLAKVEEEEALRLAAGFGGGFGRLREVCGAFSGITLVIGSLFAVSGTDDPGKASVYPRIQELGKRFRERAGSLICSELLAGQAERGGLAALRTEEYYASRPCAAIVRVAAEILEEYLQEEGVL